MEPDGNLKIAVDAIRTSQQPHHFLSVTKADHSAIVSTTGNEDCHVILRGGKQPNYDAASVSAACQELAAAGLAQRVMIDLSHSNSQKNCLRQIDVGHDLAIQIENGDDRIIGVMIESHLVEGRQDLVPGKPPALRPKHHRCVHQLGGEILGRISFAYSRMPYHNWAFLRAA